MGISSDWPKIWKAEADVFVTGKMPAATKTIFLDGQILLMQSHIDGLHTWRDLALRVFGRKLASAHKQFDHVVLAFDNYQATPVFKSIEQAKRVRASASAALQFAFGPGQKLPDKLPDAAVWQGALQNRAFKTHVICALAALILDHYTPPRTATSLTVDFINTVRVEYPRDGPPRTAPVLENAELGESDVKFMRYADRCDHLLVDSIDSDVVLIALLYTQRGGRADIFIRRFATRAPDTDAPSRKRTRPGYEIVHVRSLLAVLLNAAREALGPGLVVPERKMTSVLVVLMLMTGSDYSRGLPRIGPRTLWDNLGHVLPCLLAASQQDDGALVLDEDRTVDVFYTQLYRSQYSKHAPRDGDGGGGYAALRAALLASSLSDTVKRALPTAEHLRTTVRNLNWVLRYWHLHNANPDAPLDGSCGFLPSGHGAGVAFADEA